MSRAGVPMWQNLAVLHQGLVEAEEAYRGEDTAHRGDWRSSEAETQSRGLDAKEGRVNHDVWNGAGEKPWQASEWGVGTLWVEHARGRVLKKLIRECK